MITLLDKIPKKYVLQIEREADWYNFFFHLIKIDVCYNVIDLITCNVSNSPILLNRRIGRGGPPTSTVIPFDSACL